MSVAIVKEPW